MAGALLHGQEKDAFADAGYQGVDKREEAKGPTWQVAMRRGKRKKLNTFMAHDFLIDQIEQLKTSVRAKVEHPVPGDQAPVRLRQGALPRPGEEHGAVGHTVRCPTCRWRGAS